MEKKSLEFEVADDHEVWVHDSSVDHRGRSPSRATTGSWKAAMFIICE
jgi:hypothetical protein